MITAGTVDMVDHTFVLFWGIIGFGIANKWIVFTAAVGKNSRQYIFGTNPPARRNYKSMLYYGLSVPNLR